MLDVENSRICLQTEVNGNGRFWAGSGQAAFGSTSPQSGMAGYDNFPVVCAVRHACQKSPFVQLPSFGRKRAIRLCS